MSRERFDPLDEGFEFAPSPRIDAKLLIGIGVDHAHFGRQAAGEPRLEDARLSGMVSAQRTPVMCRLMVDPRNRSSFGRIVLNDFRVIALGVIRSTLICITSRPASWRSPRSDFDRRNPFVVKLTASRDDACAGQSRRCQGA